MLFLNCLVNITKKDVMQRHDVFSSELYFLFTRRSHRIRHSRQELQDRKAFY